MSQQPSTFRDFAIPVWQHWLSGLMHDFQGFWRRLGMLESQVLRDRLQQIDVSRPIYISGLARAGSTILLESVAAHPDVATHRYRDYWNMHTPYWSERCRGSSAWAAAARERSHGDGLMVTPDSPEAMEEILWMHFFPQLREPSHCQILDASVQHPQFEQYYRDHVAKLLLARGARRYAAKANDGITRLTYLAKLFPDLRIIIPVRAPREHVASLLKQHRLLTAAAAVHARSVAYLDRAGHFEFGVHRRPLHLGDDATTASIRALWEEGHEVRGWARYWSHVYQYLAKLIDDTPELRSAVLLVPYEELCRRPRETLTRVMRHCQLPDAAALAARCAPRLAAPTYYQPDFTPAEEQAIVDETARVAAGFGYGSAALESPRAVSQPV